MPTIKGLAHGAWLCDEFHRGSPPLAAELHCTIVGTTLGVQDGHDCSLSTADNGLRDRLTQVVHGPDWSQGRLSIVITFDEGDRGPDNHELTVVVAPRPHHVVVVAP